MQYIFLLSTLLGLIPGNHLKLLPSVVDSNVGLTILEYVPKYGYPLENHTVQTEDGYILTMHRIPHGINQTATEGRPVVLIMHGFLSSSMDFVNMGPKKAISFLLADAGYDVWLGNARGNTWSRNHVSLDPNKNKTFWDFSFHEIGIYDIAAKIDYIINKTGQEKISYVGHSQGTTSFFVLMATKPEYNDKIKVMNALAPVVILNHTKAIAFRILAESYGLINLVAQILKMYEVSPHSELLEKFTTELCKHGSEYQELCAIFLYLFGGYDPGQLDRDFLPTIYSSVPAGVSLKQLLHYLQEVNSGFFRQYDYGITGNIKMYGQLSPPAYNVSKITAAIVLHIGDSDLLSVPEDIDTFAGQLPNLIEKKHVPLKGFGHTDFLWATDIAELLNNDVMDVLKKYNE